jgi:hypothetical protein
MIKDTLQYFKEKSSLDEIAQEECISPEQLRERIDVLIRMGYLEQFSEGGCSGSCAFCSGCPATISGLKLTGKGKKLLD